MLTNDVTEDDKHKICHESGYFDQPCKIIHMLANTIVTFLFLYMMHSLLMPHKIRTV